MRFFIIVMISILFVSVVKRAHSAEANVISARASNASNDIGVGVLVGSTNGVTAEFWTSATDSWNVNVLGYGSNIGITFGRNWYMKRTFAVDRTSYIAPYLGLQAVGVFG